MPAPSFHHIIYCSREKKRRKRGTGRWSQRTQEGKAQTRTKDSHEKTKTQRVTYQFNKKADAANKLLQTAGPQQAQYRDRRTNNSTGAKRGAAN